MNLIFRLLLTFNATALLIILFLIQKQITLIKLWPDYTCLDILPNEASYLLYLAVPIVLTGLSIYISQWLETDDFKHGETSSIEHANNSFLPSYLGYFFVALSINTSETLLFVYGILFVFTFLSQALYFNPLFLLFGYEFYNITTKNGAAIFLISRHKYKTPNDIEIAKAYRINNYTFIERN